MFTPAVFKELLLPLFEDLKECFIYLPLKITTECNFSDDIKILLSNYGLNPEPFNSAINNLNKSRKSVYPESTASLTEIFHYFLELEHISIRFSAKNFSNTSFTWTDAFNTNKSETQSSLAFEKSNTLFNIASKINNETLKELTMENLKSSVRDLCVSATIFDWISNNFANAPLNDIKAEFSKFLCCVCLLQAQELAFFLSVKEEKGLKTLARLSLGLMNLIQSAKEFLANNDSESVNWINQKIEEKAMIHTSIHCLIMAEFWDGQELYEIAFDLFSTSNRLLQGSKIRNTTSLADYLKISILRSEKERQQLSYEGKKATDSHIKLEPFFLASILDLKSVLKPYSSSHNSYFAGIYPLKVIELQSEFEAKSFTVLKTLERASDEVTVIFEKLTGKVFSSVETFILELRKNILDDKVEVLRSKLNEIDMDIKELLHFKTELIKKDIPLNLGSKFEVLLKNLEKISDVTEKSKARLILNDSALVQTLIPLLKGIHSENVEKLKYTLSNYEEQSKKQFQLYENLRNEIKTADLRDVLLGAEQPSIIINEKINAYDNSAIEILRIIEAQRNLVIKAQDSWNKFLQEGKEKMCGIITGASDIPSKLRDIGINIIEIKKTFEDIIIEQNAIEYSLALEYKSKLMELLNKY